MTKEEFEKFWKDHYLETIPISSPCFKYDYPTRWFRIHSLPKSKQYPETPEEWKILFSRQNQIINDLFGDKASILFVLGEFIYEGQEVSDLIGRIYSLTNCSLVTLNPIDLHELWPSQYDEGLFFIVRFCEQKWHPNYFDKLLKDIAEYGLRAFFISLENKYIIAPYEGGIDIILNDTETRDKYKEKYKSWFSLESDHNLSF